MTIDDLKECVRERQYTLETEEEICDALDELESLRLHVQLTRESALRVSLDELERLRACVSEIRLAHGYCGEERGVRIRVALAKLDAHAAKGET